MSTTLRHLAQAFVDAAHTQSEKDFAALSDITLQKLRELRLGTPQEFHREVARVLKMHERELRITAGLPITKARQDSLTGTVEKVLKLPVRTELHEDKALLGGAIVQIGDERFDASALGMLERFATELLAPLS